MDKTLSLLVKFAALDRLTAPLRRMGAGARATGKDMAATRREVVALERSSAKVGAFKDLQAAAGKTAEKLGYARTRVEALRAAMEETDAPTKRLAAQLLVAERAAGRLETTAATQTAKLDGMGRELREAGVDIDRLADEEVRLGRSVADANKRLAEQGEIARRTAAAARSREKLSAAGDRLQGAGVRSIAGGVAIATPLVVGARAAIRFESAMAGVKKVFQGTPEEFQALSAQILELSRRTPVAADGIAEIVAAGAQSNIKGPANLIAYAEAAAKMAVAFDLLPDEAGAMMSAWRAAFGMDQGQVETLADKINYLGNTSGASALKISGIVTRIGPLGEVAGLASGEIAALGATLTSMGIEEEIAATGIKNTMLALTKGTAATKDQKAAFKSLGLEATKVAKSMQRDAAATITDVMRRIGKLPKAQQSGLLTELFGSESVGAIAPLLNQLPRLEENLRRVGDASRYGKSMQQEFLGQAGTNAAKLQRMSNRVEAMKIRLGDRLLPVVERVTDRIGNLADRVTAFADRNPRATQAVLILLAVLAAMMTTIGALAIAIGTTLGPISFLVGALRTPAASATLLQRALQLLAAPLRLIGVLFLRLGAALLLNPWGLAIAGLVALAFAIYTHWDRIKAIVSGWAPFFRQVGGMMMEGLLSMLNPARLAGHVVRLGKMGIAAFKGVLGIRSPSRVFAGLGGQMMDGLAQGLARRVEAPLSRIRAAGRQLTRSMAATSLAMGPIAAPALAMSTPSAVGARLGRASPGAPAVLPRSTRAPGAIAAAWPRLIPQIAQVPATAPLRIKEVASPIASSPAMSSVPTASGRGRPVIQISGPITIEVTGQPGQDSGALARAVADEFERRAIAAAATRDSSYEDRD